MPSPPRLLIALTGVLLSWSGPAHGYFVDGTSATGLYGIQPSWGAQAVDMDGDGDVDLHKSHHFYTAYLFTNDGTGSFIINGIPQLIAGLGDRHGYLFVDLDGDQLLEVVCSHGGGGGCGCADEGNELWRSTSPGIFVPVPGAGGMTDLVGRGRCFSAADVDGDGDLDLFHAKAPLASSPNSLYRNDGALSFVDIAPALGLDEISGTVAGLFADYDDDGDPDLLVGGEEFARPTTLWRNDGSGFVDDTATAFGSLPIVAGADWGDLDNDGDLDLAVCEGAEGVYDSYRVQGKTFWFFANHRFNDDGVDVFEFETPGEDPPAQFFWQGTFWPPVIFLGPQGVQPAAPTITLTDDYVGMPSFTPGVDTGLYVWRESPGGKWICHASAPPGTPGNFSARFPTVGGVTNVTVSGLEQLQVPLGPVRVYRNDGGVFAEITGALGLTPSQNPRAVQWVDFDNDGDLDLHQMNKGTVDIGNEADILWRNDVTGLTRMGQTWLRGFSDYFTDGGVWADFDQDGDLDVLLQEGAGPAFFSFGAPPLYYRNEGPTGNWFAVSLLGTASGGTPVGSKVTLHSGELAVHRRLHANSWRGFQGPFSLHFGLGARVVVDSLVIDWAGSARQVVGPFPANYSIELFEGDNPTGVSPHPGDELVAFAGPVVPQPSRDRQEVRLVHPAGARLLVSVYDVTGRRVRTLADGLRAGETSRITWDGKDEAGRVVPAGVYFIRGEGDVPFVRRAVRLR